MKQELTSLLLCDAAIKGQDGKTTIYGVFDIIYGPKNEFPVRHHQFTVYWKLSTEEIGEISIKIEKPDRSILIETEPQELLENELNKHEGFYTFGNVEFPFPGNYTVILLFNRKKELGRETLILQATEH